MRLVSLVLLFLAVAFSVKADEVDSILGKRFIQSVKYGKYMSATSHSDNGDKRRFLSWVSQSGEREILRIRKNGTHVSIMSEYDSGMYISGYSLYAEFTKWSDGMLWIPTKHADGAWSFKNAKHDYAHLSALTHGLVGRWASWKYDKFWIHEA